MRRKYLLDIGKRPSKVQSHATIGCFKNMRESTLLLYFGYAKKKKKKNTYTKESSKDKQYTVTEVKILQKFLEYHFCKIFYHI